MYVSATLSIGLTLSFCGEVIFQGGLEEVRLLAMGCVWGKYW